MNERQPEAICIVGHGPSLQGMHWGKRIDRYRVVRLKNCAELLKNPRDYGRRTDVMCSSTEVVRFMMRVRAPTYWCYAKRGSYDPRRVEEFARRVKPAQVIVPQVVEAYNEVFRKMGAKHPNLSTGMAALVIALELETPTEVWLAGFDKVMNPKIDGYVSTVPSPFNDGGHKDTGHDWQAEHYMLEFLREHFKIPIRDLAHSEGLICLP